MHQNTCNSCQYYRQHYTFNERKIVRVYCGHCTCLRIKTKRPDSKVCENYIENDSNDNPFVSKEYLSKKLLEYVLKLELLPDIQNDVG